MVTNELGDFFAGYARAMLWVNTVDLLTGESVDASDIYEGPGRWWEDVPTLDLDEAGEFYTHHLDLLKSTGASNFAQHGHDFALTRNGHGAGFWDRGYPDAIGQALTEAAQAYGEATLFLSADQY